MRNQYAHTLRLPCRHPAANASPSAQLTHDATTDLVVSQSKLATSSSNHVPTAVLHQSTEKINSSSSTGLGDSRTESRNSSNKAPAPFGKLVTRAKHVLTSESDLEHRSSKLLEEISAVAPKLEAIRRLLKSGADPNSCTNGGESALRLATSKDQYLVVDLLLKYGADSLDLDANGSSSMEEAFSRGYSQTALTLLKNAASLDLGYGRFGTCIQAAALGGNLELCTLVIERGWDVVPCGSGLYGSALQASVVSRNSKVVEFILSHGANINVKGGCYDTCIRAAAELEDLEICQLLISKGADVNLSIDASRTALLSAVTKENLDICHFLLDSGATITDGVMKAAWGTEGKKWDILRLLGRYGGTVDDIPVPRFSSLLQSYASQSDAEKCTVLIEYCNADVNADRGHYGTALQAAVNSQSGKLVRILLDHGANPNIMGGVFGSALHAAAACNRADLCLMLIGAGANVNLMSVGLVEDETDVNEEGRCWRTALHLASTKGYQKVVQVLLKQGSDIDMRDSNGDAALHLATKNNQSTVVKLLLGNGGNSEAMDRNGRTSLHLAASSGHQDLVKLILDKRGIINKVDSNGRTALHLAATSGHEDLVELLLDRGSSINKEDSNGEVALSLAAMNGHKAVVNLLLQRNAHIGSYESTVLRMAIRMSDFGLVELLVMTGADVNARDANGQTILQLALLIGRANIIRLLRDYGAKTTEELDGVKSGTAGGRWRDVTFRNNLTGDQWTLSPSDPGYWN